jgi:hypothetical protein
MDAAEAGRSGKRAIRLACDRRPQAFDRRNPCRRCSSCRALLTGASAVGHGFFEKRVRPAARWATVVFRGLRFLLTEGRVIKLRQVIGTGLRARERPFGSPTGRRCPRTGRRDAAGSNRPACRRAGSDHPPHAHDDVRVRCAPVSEQPSHPDGGASSQGGRSGRCSRWGSAPGSPGARARPARRGRPVRPR